MAVPSLAMHMFLSVAQVIVVTQPQAHLLDLPGLVIRHWAF